GGRSQAASGAFVAGGTSLPCGQTRRRGIVGILLAVGLCDVPKRLIGRGGCSGSGGRRGTGRRCGLGRRSWRYGAPCWLSVRMLACGWPDGRYGDRHGSDWCWFRRLCITCGRRTLKFGPLTAGGDIWVGLRRAGSRRVARAGRGGTATLLWY